MNDPLFVDTVFIQALLDKNDQHHPWSRQVVTAVLSSPVYITEAVLLEVGAALANVNRVAAATFIRQTYQTPNTHVIALDGGVFQRGLSLFANRPDKGWSLTDCISFVVMQENGIRLAVSTDRHFEQVGFQLLR